MKKPLLKGIKLCVFAGVLSAMMFSAQGPITGHRNTEDSTITATAATKATPTEASAIYAGMQLDSLGLSREAFYYALQGLERLEAAGKLRNPDIISIIDFSQPSSKKRLFVIDLKNNKVLFNTLVSHGRNSGAALATSFSNRPNSFKSSLGFYITGETYRGEHGYSLRLQGEEEGINDNAYDRGIVMHSADYVNEALAGSQGYIGRSLGCPALPEKLHRKIIQQIRNGTCLFLYSPDKYYLGHSKLLQPDSLA